MFASALAILFILYIKKTCQFENKHFPLFLIKLHLGRQIDFFECATDIRERRNIARKYNTAKTVNVKFFNRGTNIRQVNEQVSEKAMKPRFGLGTLIAGVGEPIHSKVINGIK